jgi:hypothetical protein
MIKKTAMGAALDTKLTENVKKAIYTQGAIIYFDHILQKHQFPSTS